ncbi:AraC family transcriptional regulator [Microbacterium sp. SS28]|uniref:AraC family transcriptional regulator n=1 Tax=Microbacterium sp. SS28 TaxID=2919948 RepID=UPI001FAAFB77|nr:AraC family transcriptional regulator [Microbacterium sp. SS28]
MIVDTSDRDVAAEALSRSFPGLGLSPSPDGRPFRFFHSREQRGFITYSRVDVGGVIHSSGYYPDEFALVRRLGGKIALEYGPERIDTTRPYLRPQGQSVVRFEDSRAELISLQPAVVRRLADRHLEGSGRKLLSPTAGLSKPSPHGARLWNATADMVADDDGASPIRASVLQDLVITTLLVAFPVLGDVSPPVGANVLPRALRRAVDYIDEHLAEPISITQIAEAARVSVRSLEYGFIRQFGVTPSRHLREARMRQVHAELRDSDPTQTTVAAVVHRWGIGHLGRFAAEYRAQFGENPSATLGR